MQENVGDYTLSGSDLVCNAFENGHECGQVVAILTAFLLDNDRDDTCRALIEAHCDNYHVEDDDETEWLAYAEAYGDPGDYPGYCSYLT